MVLFRRSPTVRLVIAGRKTDRHPTKIRIRPRVRKSTPRILGHPRTAKSRKAPTAMAIYPPGIAIGSAFELSDLRVEPRHALRWASSSRGLRAAKSMRTLTTGSIAPKHPCRSPVDGGQRPEDPVLYRLEVVGRPRHADPAAPPTPHPVVGGVETEGTDDRDRRTRSTSGLLSLRAEPTSPISVRARSCCSRTSGGTPCDVPIRA